MCDTNVGADSSYHALQTFSQILKVKQPCWDGKLHAAHRSFMPARFWSSFELAADLHLQKKPRGPRGRPPCAATVRDSNAVWQALWTYARELISTQRPTPQQDSKHADWDRARLHSGLDPQGKAVKNFIFFAVNSSVAELQVLCFAHEQHLMTTHELQHLKRLWLVQQSPRLLHISLTFRSSVIYGGLHVTLSDVAIYRKKDRVTFGIISLFCSLLAQTQIVIVLPQVI